MTRKGIAFDTKIRLVASLCLVLGALFTITGMENRTISELFLWVALIVSIGGLVGSFFGKRSWYGGVVILASTYIFMISRYSNSALLRFSVLILVLIVGFGGLSNNYIRKNFAKNLFIKIK